MFLANPAVNAGHLGQVDRAVLERYLAHLQATTARNRELAQDNQQLGHQLARALGQLRADGIRPRSRASVPTIKGKLPSDNNRPVLTTAISRHADSSKTLSPTSPPRSGRRVKKQLQITINAMITGGAGSAAATPGERRN
jgi:hypothetical protein